RHVDRVVEKIALAAVAANYCLRRGADGKLEPKEPPRGGYIATTSTLLIGQVRRILAGNWHKARRNGEIAGECAQHRAGARVQLEEEVRAAHAASLIGNPEKTVHEHQDVRALHAAFESSGHLPSTRVDPEHGT